MSACSVKGCTSQKYKGSDVSFHRFPWEMAKKRQWIKMCGRDDDWYPCPSACVCSKHFADGTFPAPTFINKRRRISVEKSPAMMHTEESSSESLPLANSNVEREHSPSMRYRGGGQVLFDGFGIIVQESTLLANIERHQSIATDILVKEETVDESPSSSADNIDQVASSAISVIKKEEIDDDQYEDEPHNADFDDPLNSAADPPSNQIHNATLFTMMDFFATPQSTFDEFDFDQIHIDGHSSEELRAHYEQLRNETFRSSRLKDEIRLVRTYCSDMNPSTPKSATGIPKRPLTAYFRFFLEFREETLKAQPDLTGTEIMHLAGEAWSQMDVEKRQPYIDAYNRELEEYKRDSPKTAFELFAEERRKKYLEYLASGKMEKRLRMEFANLPSEKREELDRRARLDKWGVSDVRK